MNKRQPGRRDEERHKFPSRELDKLLGMLDYEPEPNREPIGEPNAPLTDMPITSPRATRQDLLPEVGLKIAARHPWRWAGLMYDYDWLKRTARKEHDIHEEDVRWLLP